MASHQSKGQKDTAARVVHELKHGELTECFSVSVV
jgi:hypothetical protein